MDDLTPVKGPTSPFEGRSAKVIAVIVIGILVALIKPWGTSTPVPIARASAAPTAVAVTSRPGSPTPFDAFAGYDHELFGIYEPEPRSPPSAPGASASPARPVASPAKTAAPASDGPHWPATITIAEGNNLGLIGINTPLGYEIASVAIVRMNADGSEQPLDVVKPQSQWPSHFTVIGIADDTGREAVENWPAGQYRLDLSFEPGAISRSIAISVSKPTPPDVASPSPSERPATPASTAP